MKPIEEQRADYMAAHAGNSCKYCGTGNQGTAIDGLLMFYGLWNVDYDEEKGVKIQTCSFCHRQTITPWNPKEASL